MQHDSVKQVFPDGESLFLRTDFSDESAWRQMLDEVNQLVDNSRHEENDGERAPFRVVPREVSMVEVNLTLANSDFEDFAQAVDEDGVFRGSGH